MFLLWATPEREKPARPEVPPGTAAVDIST